VKKREKKKKLFFFFSFFFSLFRCCVRDSRDGGSDGNLVQHLLESWLGVL
jgi:hypothetical protein